MTITPSLYAVHLIAAGDVNGVGRRLDNTSKNTGLWTHEYIYTWVTRSLYFVHKVTHRF